MKTLETLYQEVLASEELKKDIAQAGQDAKTLEDWIRAHGCDATGEQVQAFLKEKQAKAGELSDDELSAAAGGCNGGEAVCSVFLAGIGCAFIAINSEVRGEVGPAEDTDKLLCH